MQSQTEIFRHLRSTYFDTSTNDIGVKRNGGISFLVSPSTVEAEYDFWIYICPEDAPFSSRQAVKSLRRAVSNNVVPRGSIRMDGRPIIDQLIMALVESEKNILPSESTQIAAKIAMNNVLTELKLAAWRKTCAV